MTRPPQLQDPESAERLWSIIRQHVNIKRRYADHAEIECPGNREHEDTWLRLPTGRAPYVHCFHQSCAAEVAEVNAALEEACEADELVCTSPERDKAEEQERKQLRRIRTHADRILLPQLLAEGPVTVEDWLFLSPYAVTKTPVEDHWRLLLELYRPHAKPWCDRIWCGARYETTGAWHFRTVDGWLRESDCPGPQTCQGLLFAHKSSGATIGRHGRRSSDWVGYNPWLVLESDDLPRERFGRVILYAAEDLKLRLRAIVDTGGKSLHAWFERPKLDDAHHHKAFHARWPDADNEEVYATWSKERWDAYHTEMRVAQYRDRRARIAHERRERDLLETFRGLGCDHGMWKRGSTARLPGYVRLDDSDHGTGDPLLGPDGKPRWQRLIYYDPS